MKVIPQLDTKTGLMDLIVILESKNLERIQEYDPAEVRVQDYGAPFDTAAVRRVHICFATDEEHVRIADMAAAGDLKGITALISRGWVLRKDHGDGDPHTHLGSGSDTPPYQVVEPPDTPIGGNFQTIKGRLDSQEGCTAIASTIAGLAHRDLLFPIVSHAPVEMRQTLIERFMAGIMGALIAECGPAATKHSLTNLLQSVDVAAAALEQRNSKLN